MIRILYILVVSLLILFTDGCKKNNSASGISSLNIIQAAIDVPSVVIDFSDTAMPYYLARANIGYGSNAEYGIQSGVNYLTIVSSDDTSHAVFQGSVTLDPGAIYSLYLIGNAQRVDTLLTRDILPEHKDSSSGVRVINLSPDSNPISINLQGNDPSNEEFLSLRYKQSTSFKSYPDTNNITSYTFEIRDKSSGTYLTNATWNLTVYKNSTLVICGQRDSVGMKALNVFQVNNF